LSGASPSGECALIPVINKGQVTLFIYAFREGEFSGLSPQHYLELLSWMVTARKDSSAALPESVPDAAPASKVFSPPFGGLTPARLVAKINDLPPLPALVTQALEMLSDPGVDTKAVGRVIGRDQSLVSKLLKISNSVLD
jgi:hypothetical protein